MQALIELEEKGWQSLSSAEDTARNFYRSLLANDALMLFPGGMRLEGKEKILDVIGAAPWKSFQTEELQAIALSDKAGAIVYRVTAQREGGDPYVALISSTYALHEGKWKLVLHQQTPV